MSSQAQRWPDIETKHFQLRLESADGKLIKAFSMEELQRLPQTTRSVTHRCSTTGNSNERRWTGVQVKDLLPEERNELPFDAVVTFVGMDGFGYSLLRSRALQQDVSRRHSLVELDTVSGEFP